MPVPSTQSAPWRLAHHCIPGPNAACSTVCAVALKHFTLLKVSHSWPLERLPTVLPSSFSLFRMVWQTGVLYNYDKYSILHPICPDYLKLKFSAQNLACKNQKATRSQEEFIKNQIWKTILTSFSGDVLTGRHINQICKLQLAFTQNT